MKTKRYNFPKKNFKGVVFDTINDNRSIIIRLIVGLIFLSEGIQKFIFPDNVGSGRFEKIGFQYAEFWAIFVAIFEIVCGLSILLGFITRVAAIPLFIIMITAFVTTKLPLLAEKGFWHMAHEYRTDFSLTLLLIYLFIYGAGKLSADSVMNKNHRPRTKSGRLIAKSLN